MVNEKQVVRGVIFDYVRGRLETPSTAITQYVEQVSAAIARAERVATDQEFFRKLARVAERIDNSNQELAEVLAGISNMDPDASDEEIQAQQTKFRIRELLTTVRGSAELISKKGGPKIAPQAELIVTEADRALKVTGILEEADRFFDLEWTIRQDLALAPPDLDVSIGPGSVLVIDSDPTMRDLLCDLVDRFGGESHSAATGEEGLELLNRAKWNLILLDLVLDDMTGFKVLEDLSSRGDDTPVIIVTSVQQDELLGAAIRMGARDVLQKPPSKPLLRARINSAIERKRLMDRAQNLVHSILPKDIATRWMDGRGLIADRYEHAAILFTDLVGFTQMSAKHPPQRLLLILNDVFEVIDQLIEEYGVEKIKTIGDAYMIASGLPSPAPDARTALRPLAELALRLPEAVEQATRDFNKKLNKQKEGLQIRVGIHVGPAVAGVIGERTIAYDVWGETVNLASRMESHGEPGRVHVTEDVRSALEGDYLFEPRAQIEVKGVGLMPTHFLTRKA